MTTTQRDAHTVAAYLRGITANPISNVRPCRVTLGKETFEGARYTQTGHYTATMRAVTEGKFKDGDAYTEEGFYLLMDGPCWRTGKQALPASYRRDKAVYQIDGGEWYVAGYYEGDANEQQPLGAHFLLKPWDLSDGSKVDDFDKKRRPRLVVKIDYL